MKKLYEKSEIGFAVLWIVIYCMLSGSLRGSFGNDSPWLLAALALIAVCLTCFVKQNRLEVKYGLNGWPANQKVYLYFIPLWILATGNLWGGIIPDYTGVGLLCAVLSMALIGYIEELIFRGLLFRALLKNRGTKWAVIIAAVSFGIGHIVNLFAGQTTAETIVQVPFAVAWGFLFTMTFFKSGSLLPGVLAHSLVDVFSVFGTDTPASTWGYVIVTIVTAVVWCLYLNRLETRLSADPQ